MTVKLSPELTRHRLLTMIAQVFRNDWNEQYESEPPNINWIAVTDACFTVSTRTGDGETVRVKLNGDEDVQRWFEIGLQYQEKKCFWTVTVGS